MEAPGSRPCIAGQGAPGGEAAGIQKGEIEEAEEIEAFMVTPAVGR
jgi:hypothetical protein